MVRSSPFLQALAALAFLPNAAANVEKTIFIAPEAVSIPSTHPTLDDLDLPTLTPQNSSKRTHITAQFPTDTAPLGPATWLLLDDLKAGQRYEVRICWPAVVSVFVTRDPFPGIDGW
jgi:hypothetical protein